MSCPPLEELLAWQSQQPADDSTAALEAHVQSGCAHCRRQLQLLHVLFETLGEPAPPTVPLELRQRVLEQLRSMPTEPATGSVRPALTSAIGHFQEFISEILDPVTTPTLALGLRGESETGLRRYRAGPFVLDVGLVERRAILGQLLDDNGADAEGFAGSDCILCGSEFTQQVVMDDDACFRFERAGPGRYAMMIESPNARLVFPDVDLAVPED